MSRLVDWRQHGIWVGQHHDPNASLAGRRGLAMARIVASSIDPDQAIHDDAEDTHGTVLGELLGRERPGKRDGLHGWWFTGCPVISTGEAPDGDGVTRERGAAPGGAGSWLPQRSAGVADARFDPFSASARHPVLPDQLWPGGQTGLMSAGSEEDRQEEILHLDFLGLVAPHRNGPGRAGTPVFDLDATGNLDPARWARIQALARVAVVPPRAASAPGVAGAVGRLLAWQMGEARDGTLTGGLVADRAGAGAQALEAIERDGEDGDLDGDAVAGDEVGENELRVGGVTFFGPRPRSLGDGTQTGGDVVVFDGLREGETRERERTETEADDGAGGGGGTVVPGPEILACASHWMGGLIDVGAAGDVHQIGQSLDGEAINSAHVSADAPHRSNDGFWDVGLEYRREVYEPTDRGPLLMPVYHRVDPAESHTTATGTFPGLGRWQAETAIGWIPPDEPGGSRIPGGGGGSGIPGGGGLGDDEFGGGGGDGDECGGGGAAGMTTTDDPRGSRTSSGHKLTGSGFPGATPSGRGFGHVPLNPDGTTATIPGGGLPPLGELIPVPGFRATQLNEKSALAYSLGAFAAPSFAFRPQLRVTGAPDFRRARSVPRALLNAHNNTAPIVGSLMAFAKEDGAGYVHGDRPCTKRWRGGDADGVTMFVPSDICEGNATDPATTSARSQSAGVHRGMTWGHGIPATDGGSIVDGWRETVDSTNNKIVTPVDAAGATRAEVRLDVIAGFQAQNADGSRFVTFRPGVEDTFKVSGVALARFITPEVSCSNDLAAVRLIGQLGSDLTVVSRYGFAGAAPKVRVTGANAGAGSGVAGGDIVLLPGNGDGAGGSGRLLY